MQYVFRLLLLLRLLLVFKVFFIAGRFMRPSHVSVFLTAFCVRHVIYERQTNYNDQTPLQPNSCQGPLDTEGASNNLIGVHVFLVLGICTCGMHRCICIYVCACNYNRIGQCVRTLLLSDPVNTRRSFGAALARSMASNLFNCPANNCSYFMGQLL